MNPFRHGCVVDGEYFCPRPEPEIVCRVGAERRRAWRAAHGQDFSHQVIPLAVLIFGILFSPSPMSEKGVQTLRKARLVKENVVVFRIQVKV